METPEWLTSMLGELRCNKCEMRLMDDVIPQGQSSVMVAVPNIEEYPDQRCLLCGECTLKMFEFLVPGAHDDREYAGLRAELDALLTVKRAEAEILGGE